MAVGVVSKWIKEYQSNQPKAKQAAAWACLTLIAAPGGTLDWLEGYDSREDEIIYKLKPWHATRRLNYRSFSELFRLVRQRVAAERHTQSENQSAAN